MLNFYGLDCVAVRNDYIQKDFLRGMYDCYDWDESSGSKVLINSKNYKYKKGIASLLPLVVLRMFQYLKVPSHLSLFKREINVEDELEFVQTLDMSTYKTCLNSDITILLGIALLKN